MTTTATDHPLLDWMREVRAVNEANGWFDADRSLREANALMHSEVAEALEAYRDHKLEDPTEPGWGVQSEDGKTYRVGGWFDGEWVPGSRDDAEREAANLRETEPTAFARPVAKPEGVGSELADVLIRLLDQADRFDIDVTKFEAAPVPEVPAHFSFADALDWLHGAIAKITDPDNDETTFWRGRVTTYARVYVRLRAICDRFEVDLAAEYHRKLAFNKTRGYRHGGRTL